MNKIINIDNKTKINADVNRIRIFVPFKKESIILIAANSKTKEIVELNNDIGTVVEFAYDKESEHHFYDDSHVVEYNVEISVLPKDILDYIKFIKDNLFNKDILIVISDKHNMRICYAYGKLDCETYTGIDSCQYIRISFERAVENNDNEIFNIVNMLY